MEEPDENMTAAERRVFDEKIAAMARKNPGKPNGWSARRVPHSGAFGYLVHGAVCRH